MNSVLESFFFIIKYLFYIFCLITLVLHVVVYHMIFFHLYLHFVQLYKKKQLTDYRPYISHFNCVLKWFDSNPSLFDKAVRNVEEILSRSCEWVTCDTHVILLFEYLNLTVWPQKEQAPVYISVYIPLRFLYTCQKGRSV